MADGTGSFSPTSERKRARGRRGLWVALALVVVAAIVVVIARSAREPERVVRWSVLPPAGVHYEPAFGSPALSPDGTRIAFAAESGPGERSLWLQGVGSLEAERLPGSEGAKEPFWSPDSGSIGFFAAERLRVLDLAGGTVRDLAEALAPRGGSWGRTGSILFAPSITGPIFRVPAAGGVPEPVTRIDVDSDESSHWFPTFLPDGDHFLYVTQGGSGPEPDDGLAVAIASVASGVSRRLVERCTSARYVHPGLLIFQRGDDLFAQRFDLKTLGLSGLAQRVVSDVGRPFFQEPIYSISENGLLLYQQRAPTDDSRLTWVDRRGEELGTIGRPARYSDLALSHDEKRVVASIVDPLTGKSDLWVVDLERGTSARLTFESGNDFVPIWSPDDRKIYYYSERSTGTGTFVRPSDGQGESRPVFVSDDFNVLWSISPDGASGWLMINHFAQGTRWDVERLDLRTGGTRTVLGGPHRESAPAVSPDGRWLAFHSDASGQKEIYVVPTEGDGGPWRVSTDGGTYPQWSSEGREVLYRAADGWVEASRIRTLPTFSADPPVRLFRPLGRPPLGHQFVPARDGSRFLVNQPSEPRAAEPWILVENWRGELRP